MKTQNKDNAIIENITTDIFKMVSRSLTFDIINKKVTTKEDAIEVANLILDKSSCLGYYRKSETPIKSIIESFGIKVDQIDDLDKIRKNISGVIYANGDTIEKYGSDKIILTDNKEPLGHQNFVMAHELGHYLFDFLGDELYADKNILFSEFYPKGNHSSNAPKKEKLSDRFAAELLMPTDLFVEQYNYAINYDYGGNLKRYFALRYLSKFFKVKMSSVEKRITEVLYD